MSLQMARPIGTEVLETSDWVRAHEAVLVVAKERAGLERREGICLLRALRRGVHRHLGHGAFAEYTDRYLGYCQRTTADKLRTAEALEYLPDLAGAQRDGRLNASVVRELARVATPETQAEWIAAATGLRVREVERLVWSPAGRSSNGCAATRGGQTRVAFRGQRRNARRAEGGSNRPENLISVCCVHHSAVHGGQIVVSGTAGALDVRDADGTPYGGAVCAPRSDLSEKVFRGLRWLGFKERAARAAVQAALRESASADGVPLDDAALLRRALSHLG